MVREILRGLNREDVKLRVGLFVKHAGFRLMTLPAQNYIVASIKRIRCCAHTLLSHETIFCRHTSTHTAWDEGMGAVSFQLCTSINLYEILKATSS